MDIFKIDPFHGLGKQGTCAMLRNSDLTLGAKKKPWIFVHRWVASCICILAK